MDNEDEDAQRRYKRRILRELYAGMHNRRIRTWNGGYGCPFCNQKLHDAYLTVLAHARGPGRWLLQAEVFSQVGARRIR